MTVSVAVPVPGKVVWLLNVAWSPALCGLTKQAAGGEDIANKSIAPCADGIGDGNLVEPGL